MLASLLSLHLLIAILLSGLVLSSSSLVPPQENDYPPWTKDGVNGIECGDTLKGIVECQINEQNVSLKLRFCFCMTYNEDEAEVYVGHCSYTCDLNRWIDHNYDISLRVQNVSLLNEEVCKKYYREGQMCGRCKENYGLPVYSYSSSCVQCPHDNYRYNWLKYIAVAYGPLTVFFFLVLFLRVSVTSGSVMGYVTISQIVATPSLIRFYYILNSNNSNFSNKNLINYILVPHTLWNLDIFRTLFEPFCLNPRMSPMVIATLDYILAIYPMFLIVVCIVLVKVYDRSNLLSWIWGPFYRCLMKFRI